MCLATPSSARKEMAWSIPPDSEPTYCSARAHISPREAGGEASASENRCTMLRAEAHSNAELLDKPDPGGTSEYTRMSNPRDCSWLAADPSSIRWYSPLMPADRKSTRLNS